jgi:hypothetical protein
MANGGLLFFVQFAIELSIAGSQAAVSFSAVGIEGKRFESGLTDTSTVLVVVERMTDLLAASPGRS